MWKNKVILALIVSTTANTATKNDDLPQESFGNDGAYTMATTITGYFSNSAQPTISRVYAAPKPGPDSGSPMASASLNS